LIGAAPGFGKISADPATQKLQETRVLKHRTLLAFRVPQGPRDLHMFWAPRILTALSAALLAGCATTAASPASPTRTESLRTMDPTRIQADTMGFADRLIMAMTRVYDHLERRASTPAARDTAHQLKTEIAIGAVGNAVNPRPIAGLMDMLVLVRLSRQIAEDPGTAQTFGADTPGLVEALRRRRRTSVPWPGSI